MVSLFELIFYCILSYLFYSLFEYIHSIPLAKISKEYFYKVIFMIPYYKKKIGKLETEKIKFTIRIEKSMFSHIDNIYHNLPENGTSDDLLYSRWQNNNKWLSGKFSGAIYNIDSELDNVIFNVMKLSLKSNTVHSDMFPIERQVCAEIINITRQLFHGNENVVGVITSGGTESILMACLAARNRAYDLYNITNPEIIVPMSAHAAFDKAGSYFQIKIVRVPLDNNFMVDLSEVKLAINKNTVMVVGSYPNFPQGIIDPIDKLAQLIQQYNDRIGLHVDGCLGGFLIPFMKDAGYNVPIFDFSLIGVTSLSADTDKFGNGPKGVSVLLHRDRGWRKYQYSFSIDWMGGIYGTPSILGSHSGAVISATWAVMMKLGRNGYIEYTRNIMDLTKDIIEKIKKIDGLEILGDPLLSVIAFTFKKENLLNIYDLQDEMKERGWFLNELQNPSGLHICITSAHTQIENFESLFITDLEESISELKSRPNTNKLRSTATLYGGIQMIPKDFSTQFIELYFDVNHQHSPKYIHPNPQD